MKNHIGMFHLYITFKSLIINKVQLSFFMIRIIRTRKHEQYQLRNIKYKSLKGDFRCKSGNVSYILHFSSETSLFGLMLIRYSMTMS